MAATAKWEYVKNKHFVVYQGKIYIIDQVTHKVMFDPETSTESRWNGGLAQAIEAEHNLTIRDDPGTCKSVTARELYTGERYDTVVGASGTANGKNELFAAQGLSDQIHDVPRYHPSQLDVAEDRVLPDSEQKLAAVAADTVEMVRAGRPVLILAHENDLVADLSAQLGEHGVTHTAIDALWFLEHGVHGEADFQNIIDHAGEPGKVTVVNMQGARGVDIPVSKESLAAAGPHLPDTGPPAQRPTGDYPNHHPSTHPPTATPTTPGRVVPPRSGRGAGPTQPPPGHRHRQPRRPPARPAHPQHGRAELRPSPDHPNSPASRTGIHPQLAGYPRAVRRRRHDQPDHPDRLPTRSGRRGGTGPADRGVRPAGPARSGRPAGRAPVRSAGRARRPSRSPHLTPAG